MISLRPTRITFAILALLLLITFLTSFAFAGVFCGFVGPCIQPWYYEHPAFTIPFYTLTWPFFVFEKFSFHRFIDFGLARDVVQSTFLGIGILSALFYQYAAACTVRALVKTLFIHNQP